jgi:hypothetical protein
MFSMRWDEKRRDRLCIGGREIKLKFWKGVR